MRTTEITLLLLIYNTECALIHTDAHSEQQQFKSTKPVPPLHTHIHTHAHTPIPLKSKLKIIVCALCFVSFYPSIISVTGIIPIMLF